MALSEQELAILSTLNIDQSMLSDLIKQAKVASKAGKAHDAPKATDLTKHSGKVTRHCICCGATTITFVDYLKRDKESGYCLKTVSTPSNKVDRFHFYDVLRCTNCDDESLAEASNEELIKMIKNLRSKIVSNERKGDQRQ